MRIPKPGQYKAPERFVRFATKSPTGAGERRALRRLPIDDFECSKRGFSLVGPVMNAGVLAEDEYRELMKLSRLYNWEFKGEKGKRDLDRRGELLAKLPRCSVVGIDVDADKSQGEEAFKAAREIAELLVDKFALLGYQMTVFHSSGEARPGLHLHLGFVNEDARAPDLDRTFLRLVSKLAHESGLVDHEASPTKKARLTLVRPCDRDNPAPPAKVDLIPFNHAPRSKGRLFRPEGGFNKDKSGKKTMTEWSRFKIASPIDKRLVAMAPAEEVAPKKASRIKPNFKFKPIKRPKSRKLDYVLKPLIQALQSLASPGFNHELRLALCGVAISKSLLSREDWVYALDHGIPDKADADESVKCWEATAQLNRLSQPHTGAGKLRKLVGTEGVRKIAFALAEITNESAVDVLSRFGRTVMKYQREHSIRLQAAFMDRRDAFVKEGNDRQVLKTDRLIKFLTRSDHCGDFTLTPTCKGCEKHIHDEAPIYCEGVLCGSCTFKKIKTFESWLRENWPDNTHKTHDRVGRRLKPSAVVFDGFKTRRDAFKISKRMIRGLKLKRIIYANPDASYSVLIFSIYEDATLINRVGWTDRDGAEHDYTATRVFKKITTPELIRVVVDGLARNHVAIMSLIERREYHKAAKILDEIRGAHGCYGRLDKTPWPTSKHIQFFKKEKAIALDETRDRSHLCDLSCASDCGTSYEYTHTKTGWSTCSANKYPMTFDQVIARRSFEDSLRSTPVEIVARE